MQRIINRLKDHRSVLAQLLLLIAAVSVIYAPGLHGPFVLDDAGNITGVKAIAMTRLSVDNLLAAADGGGIFCRPLASLSFALNHYFSGGFEDTFPYKLTNLVVHLINALLIYRLTLLIGQTPALRTRITPAQSSRLAFLTATLWAVHPIQLTNVLYVVQRMNSLSALFVIAGLTMYLKGRLRLESGNKHGLPIIVSSLTIGTIVGLGAKENAVLLPLLALTLEYSLFSITRLAEDRRKSLLIAYAALLLLPAAIFAIYLFVNPGFVDNAYLSRTFTPYERLLTESRVLWIYIGLLLWPRINDFGLFHDDIALSTSLTSPMTTLFAVIGILSALCLVVPLRKRSPVAAFAILWFLTAHALESTFFDLEIAFEHRNYLPSFGIMFGVSYLLTRGTTNLSFAPVIRRIVIPALLIVVAFVTWSRAHQWSSLDALALSEVSHHPESVRANGLAAWVSLERHNDIYAAVRYDLNNTRIAPRDAGAYIELRILLAQLTTALNHAAPDSESRPKPPRPTLLAPEIQMFYKQDGIHLRYPPSSSAIIEDLLRTKPVTVYTVAALEYLRKCLLATNSPCAPIEQDALGWYSAALNNPRMAPGYRVIILSDAARARAEHRDYAQAAALMKGAVELAPELISYRLDLVDYLERSSQMNEARRASDALDAMMANDNSIGNRERARARQLRLLLNRESVPDEAPQRP